jgi:hypothetical protein
LLHIRITASPKARVSSSVVTLEVGLVGGIFATPEGASLTPPRK